MKNPIEIIENVKQSFREIIEEYDLKNYSGDMDGLLNIYSADLCMILLDNYPGATIMINKNYRSCGTLISGNVYTSAGIVDKLDYIIAGEEEIRFIKYSFNKLTEDTINKLNLKLYQSTKTNGESYKLKKHGGNNT